MFLFNNDKIKVIEQDYLSTLDKNFPTWIAIRANKDNDSLSELREVNFDSSAYSFLDDIENKKLIYRGNKSSKFKNNYQASKELFSLSVNSIGHAIIEDFKEYALTDPKKDDINLDAEARAHEWLRVSLTVLKKALVDAGAQRDDLLKEIQFQGELYYGVHPKKNLKHLRVVAFNLDLEFTMQEDMGLSLNIVENGRSDGSGKKYIQTIYRMKPQITDEIIGLLSDFNKALSL